MLAKVTSPSVSSGDASKSTLRRCSKELEMHRCLASKNSPTLQLKDEMRCMTSEERKELLATLEFKIELPALTGLAMKADLCLPWSKMRTMRK